jgi:hypothetical protein
MLQELDRRRAPVRAGPLQPAPRAPQTSRRPWPDAPVRVDANC